MTNFSIGSYLEILDELFIGSRREFTWVVNRDGVFDTLEKVNAREASEPVNQHDSTIAAHAEHLRWALEYAHIFLEGREPTENWDDSWGVKSVGEEEWRSLQQRLRGAYEKLRENITSDGNRTLTEQASTGLLAVLPHTSYHLGAIRQMIIRL